MLNTTTKNDIKNDGSAGLMCIKISVRLIVMTGKRQNS